jgi:VRR-NUC domain
MQIHCAYVAWCRRLQTQFPALARGFHPANGELRTPATAAKLKRMGVRAGVLDWCLPVARGHFASLWIEFKRPGGKPTEEQRHEIEQLRANGSKVEICDDWEKAAKITLEYLQLEAECPAECF